VVIKSLIARWLPQHSFARNIAILTGGTAFAQGLMALSLPILTRLYSPEDFNLLAVYMSIVALITVASCLRLNVAIPLPESNSDAMNLLALSCAATGVVTIGLAALIVLMPDTLVGLLQQPELKPYLWMIPMGVCFASLYNALQFWASRKKNFKLVTQTRVTRAVGGAGTQLGFGVTTPSPFGLLLGHMIYSGMGVGGLARAVWRQDRALLSKITLRAMSRNLKTQRRFPLYSVPEALFNYGGGQIPILIIAAIAVGPEAGFLMLAVRALSIPMALVGSSVAQVYLAEAPQKLRDGTLALFTRKTIFSLLKSGAPPLLAVGVASPFLFPYIFGDEWGRAGTIVAWMTPSILLQFVTSPISTVLHITGRLGTAMTLQAFGFVVRVGAVLAMAQISEGWTVEAFAVASALFYSAYISLIFNILKNTFTMPGRAAP